MKQIQPRRTEGLLQISSLNRQRLTFVALPVLSALWLAVGIGVIGGLSLDYSHVSEFMSALGASGAPFAHWTNYAVFIPAELWLLLFFGVLAVRLPHSKSKWFSITVLSSYAILLIFVAIFPCDAGCHSESDSNSPATTNHILHLILAAIAYPIAFIGILPLSLTAPRHTYLKRFALPITAIGFGLICAIVLVPDAQGLFQRLIEALIYVQLVSIGWYAASFSNSVKQ